MGDPYGAINFGEFRKYMQNKQSKLKEQEAGLIDFEDSKLPSLLKGFSIHINGYTDPPQSELRKLIVALGGDYQHYLRKSKVTHIIATTLTNSKMEEFRAYKVVTPDWILDSKRAGRLLPWNQYRVIRNQNRQKELVFNDNAIKLKDSNSITSVSSTNLQSTPYVNTSNNSNSINKNGCTKNKDKQKQCMTVVSTNNNDNNNLLANSCNNKKINASIDNLHQDNSNYNNSNSISINLNDEHTLSLINQQQQYEKTENAPINRNLNSSLSTWDRHHTSIHPDFIKNYYKSSRLHYLSAMREELKDIVRKAEQQQQLHHNHHRSSNSLLTNGSKQHLQSYIMHIDFDCFFTAVGIKDRPELKDQPVAVAHGKGLKENSSSDIASCNYFFFFFGVSNGMLLGKAKKMCPNLKIIPYDFEKYKATSTAFYNILFKFTKDIQAVSVDEALVEVWAGGYDEIDALATTLRDDIRQQTGCETSIGIGSNILLARLSTKKAKPCGQYYCKPEEIDEFLSNQKVTDLPGVGYAMSSKFKDLNVDTVGDLKKITLATLTSKFGLRTGQLFFNYARGIDERKIIKNQPRKSVSAEITWAIRFENKNQINKFLKSLSVEVSERLQNINKKGRSITLKILVKSANASKETKYLGRGECDSHSKSILLDKYTDDADTIAHHVTYLFDSLHFTVINVRGIGIHIQKLNNEEEEDEEERINSINDKNKLFFRPAESPNKNKNTVVDNTSLKDNMVVDYSVFMELPQTIRQELKEKNELQLINQPITSYEHQNSIPNTNNNQINDIAMDEIDSDDNIEINENNFESSSIHHSSPTLMSQSIPDLPSWSQLDPSALLELPENMQRQILEAYKKMGKKKQENKAIIVGEKNDNIPKQSSSTSTRNDASKIKKPPQQQKQRYHNSSVKAIQKQNGKDKGKMNSNTHTLTQLYISSDQEKYEDIVLRLNKNKVESNHHLNHDQDKNTYHKINQLDVEHPIDMEVWSELPKDIQQELLSDYNQYRESAANQTNIISKNSKKIKEPKLMGVSELNDVRELITTWIENYTEVPHENDVIKVKTYFLNLVRCKELEKVHLLLLHLINVGKKKGGFKWGSILDDIQQSVSNAIENEYNTSLHLK
ncbi:hypothetical protein BJ944DRAFT_248566 [Cunninghamella echinulata]|nr:hypothetical protein BJ944DRAFT_248566 [Cunninghamella echinulata]